MTRSQAGSFPVLRSMYSIPSRLVGKITAQAAVDVVCAGVDPQNYLNKPARP